MEVVGDSSGLQCLQLLPRYHQISIDPDQIKHRFSGAAKAGGDGALSDSEPVGQELLHSARKGASVLVRLDCDLGVHFSSRHFKTIDVAEYDRLFNEKGIPAAQEQLLSMFQP